MTKGERGKDKGEKGGITSRGGTSPLTLHQFTNSSIYYSLLFSLLSLLLSFFLYAPTLFHPAMYDTLLHTQLADDLTLASVWLPSDKFGFYRPLVFLPLVLMQRLTGGYTPLLMHLINVMMHVINVALLISLVRRVWHDNGLAAVTGLLFAAFPFAYQALAIYGNNPYLAVTLLILLGLHAVVGQIERRQKGEPIRKWQLLLIFALALLTHEMGILLLPLGLFLAWICDQFGGGRAGRENTKHEETASTPLDVPPTTTLRVQQSLTGQHFANSTINYFIQFLSHHLPFIILASLYLVLYLFLPRGAGPLLDYGGNAFAPKLLLLLQTLTYPLVPLFDLVLSGPIPIWTACVTLIILLAAAQYRLNRGRAKREPVSINEQTSFPLDVPPTSSFTIHNLPFTIIFALFWFLLCAALIAFTLPTYYIEDGARLLYPMGIGVALVWGSLFSVTSHQLPVTSRVWHDNRLTRTKGLASLAHWLLVTLLLFTVIHNAWFTQRMVGLYDMLATSVWGIEEIALENEPDTHVYVNFPQWVSWPEKVWPQGNEFAPLLGDHLFMSELLRVNFGVEPDIVNLHVPERLANTPFAYGVYGVSAVSALDLTRSEGNTSVVFTQTYTEQGPQTTYTGQFGPAEDQSSLLATLGGMHVVDAAACINGNVVEVEMMLQQVDKVGLNQTFFVQALDASGQLVGQADGPAVGLPPGRIQIDSGSRVIDRRIVPITATPLEILFGLYDFTNGERAIALDALDRQLADNSVRLNPTICR